MTTTNKIIRRIQGVNVQGQSFEHDLAAVTVFTGRNGSGKTTRLNTISLVVTGGVAGVASPKKPNEVFDRMATGNPMEVRAWRGDDSHLSRKWEEVRGSVKATTNGGPAVEVSEVLTNPGAFFDLSGPERVKFIFGRAAMPEDMTTEALRRTVTANLKNIRAKENIEQTEAAIAALVLWLDGRRRDVQPQAWLGELVPDVKEKVNEAAAAAKRLTATLEGMTQVSTDAPADPEAEEKLMAARRALEAAADSRSRAEMELTGARREYQRMVDEASAAVDEAEVRKRLATLSEARAGLWEKAQHNPSDNAELKAFLAAEKDFEAARVALNSAESDVKEAEEAVEAAQSETTCPHCGQSTVEVKKKVIAQLRRKLADVKAKLGKGGVNKNFASADVAWWVAKSALDEARKKITEHRAILEQYKTVDREHADLKHGLSANEAAATAKAALPGLVAKGVALKNAFDAADKEHQAASFAHGEAQAEASRLTAQRARAQSRARVVVECGKARAEAEVASAFHAMLAELLRRLTETVVGPVLERANKMCAGILRHPLSYEDGEFKVGGATARTMSGTEKTLVYAAVSAALAADSPLRLVMLDEFDIDAANWRRLCATLCGLVSAGEIDQAVLAHTVGPEWEALKQDGLFVEVAL